MNKKTYERLMKKLNDLEADFSPNSFPAEPLGGSVGLITDATTIDQIPNEQLSLFHCMLHMFYDNKSGHGLSRRGIERLHKEVEPKLEKHLTFDKLDE